MTDIFSKYVAILFTSVYAATITKINLYSLSIKIMATIVTIIANII